MNVLTKLVFLLLGIGFISSSVFMVDTDSIHFELPFGMLLGGGDDGEGQVIGDIAYDETTQTMRVNVDGAQYIFCDMPFALAEDLAENMPTASLLKSLQSQMKC